jgi:hypothetical protein
MVMGCAALTTVGCTEGAYTGGGWLRSAQLEGASKDVRDGVATFGFQGQSRDRDGDGEIDDVKGELQYNDHANKVAFHGDVADGGFPGFLAFEICSGGECVGGEVDENGDPILSEQVYVANGTYQPSPKQAGPGGTFEMVLVDWGQEGPDEGDYLSVTLAGGVYDGYSNSGFVKGGNLSAHER